MIPDSRILRRKVAVILLTITATCNAATVDTTVVESVRERLSWLTDVVSPLYDNPAVRPLQYRYSLTSIGIGAESCRKWMATVKAETFQHMGASTVWGNASYSFGKIDDRGVMSSSVTPDAGVSPYLPATDRGGVFSSERYAFMGGYSLNKGGWSYGATLSYDARLSYRNVDPRPKNISGTLSATVGVARSLSAYRDVAAYLGYSRYTQSSSVMFVSQQGADPVYHLTGLGSRYRRFDGMGFRSDYGSNRFIAGVSTYPRQQGWMASVAMQAGKLSAVLTDLNNLPLSSMTQYDVTAQAGYMTPQWYAGLHGTVGGTSGKENIFGDPMASVYPVIASRKSYSDQSITVGANGVGCLGSFTLRGEVDYRYLSERYYADMRSLSLHTLTGLTGVQWQRLWGKCLVSAEGCVGCSLPVGGSLQLPSIDAQTDPVGTRLAREVKEEYDYADSSHLSARLSVFAAVPVKRLALTAGVSIERIRFFSYNLFLSVCF